MENAVGVWQNDIQSILNFQSTHENTESDKGGVLSQILEIWSSNKLMSSICCRLDRRFLDFTFCLSSIPLIVIIKN